MVKAFATFSAKTGQSAAPVNSLARVEREVDLVYFEVVVVILPFELVKSCRRFWMRIALL